MTNFTIVCLIIGLNLATYWRTIFYGLVVDDLNRNKPTTRAMSHLSMTEMDNLLTEISASAMSPMPTHAHFKNQEEEAKILKKIKIPYWKKVWGSLRASGDWVINKRLDHSLTLAIHTLASILIYFAFGSNIVSFIAAILFSVHPVNTQISIWLNGKRYGINAILVLLMFLFQPWGIIFYPLTPYWQPNAFFAPLIYLAKGHWWVLLFLPLSIFLAKRRNILTLLHRLGAIPDCELKKIRWKKLIILVKSFGYYFKHCLFPTKLSFYHMFLESFGFNKDENKYWYSYNFDFWVGLISLIGVSGLIVHFWSTPLGFGLFWWVVFMMQWLNFPITCTQSFSERYTYIANIGLVVAISWGLLQIPIPELRLVAITGLFTYYLTRLLMYMPSYKNLTVFHRHTLYTFPKQFRIRGTVANQHFLANRMFHAIAECGTGLLHWNRDFALHIIIAKSFIKFNQKDAARLHIQKARENIVPGKERDSEMMIAFLEKELEKSQENVNIAY